MKANFNNANLHCADLTNCNLLGASFDGAKLEHVIWGDTSVQEQEADVCDNLEQKTIYSNKQKRFIATCV